MFEPGSRYAQLPNVQYVAPGGRHFVCKERRFPPVDPPRPQSRVRVQDGERLDTISARKLGDPLLFWRIADANGAMNPFDLLVAGNWLDVPVVTFVPRDPS